MLGMFGLIDYVKIGAGLIVGAFVTWLIVMVLVVPYKIHSAKQEGRAEIVEQVTKQNAQAGAVARSAKANVDSCYDSNGEWDQETGKCIPSAQ